MKILSMALFLLSLPVWGYNFTKDFKNGFYWENLPVKFTISESNTSRRELLKQLSQQAIGEWESRTGLSIWDYQENGGTSNVVRWSTKFAAETNMDETSVLAVAIRYTEGPYFTKTEIVINGNHPDIKNNPSNLLTTLTHEFGHTVGLDHSDDWDAVMAPTLHDPYYGLANDDISGMTDLHTKTTERQVTRYVSPLASEKSKSSSSNGLSCGTVSTSASVAHQGMFSMGLGLLIGFVRKLLKAFKSFF